MLREIPMLATGKETGGYWIFVGGLRPCKFLDQLSIGHHKLFSGLTFLFPIIFMHDNVESGSYVIPTNNQYQWLFIIHTLIYLLVKYLENTSKLLSFSIVILWT